MNKKEFLSFSLPFKLKCQVTDKGNITISELNAVYSDGTCTFHHLVESDKGFSDVKPILRPLSDLSIEIEHNGEKLIPITKILEQSCFDTSKMTYKEQCSYIKGFVDPLELLVLQDAILLLKWNFDIAGLIDKNEAVDYHTLEGFVF